MSFERMMSFSILVNLDEKSKYFTSLKTPETVKKFLGYCLAVFKVNHAILYTNSELSDRAFPRHGNEACYAKL